jgi:hypothetical protein
MEPYKEPRRSFWGRGTIAAGMLLLIVLLLLAYIVFDRNGSNHTGTPTPSTASTATTGSADTDSTPSTTTGQTKPTSCNLPDSDQSIPEVTPQGITWNLYQTVALPSSSTAGPEIVDGDIARCYAHTPLGALLAASQIPYRYLIAPNWRAVDLEQVMPGVGRDKFMAERAAADTNGGNQPGDYNQLAGFKFVTYSPAVAVIEMASKSDSGAMQAGAVTVDWSSGDWKLQLQPDGSSSPQELPITSLVGFSIWSGV